MQILGQATSGPSADGDIIKDGRLDTFAQDVIQASETTPILVDFWAPWCGPCKQLTPVLEKVVREAGGRVRLVKINIDENPELARELRVQSVPTVYAFVQGRPVTGFTGAQPESQIKALVDQLAGAPAEDGVGDAEDAAKAALESGAAGDAAEIYSALLEETPDNVAYIGGLARSLIALGRLDDAQTTLDSVDAKNANDAEITGAKAALELTKIAGQAKDPVPLMARLEVDPNDHEARFDLATSLFLKGQIDPAIDELVVLVKHGRDWEDDAGRKRLLMFFDALGVSHPSTISGRRKLSAVLFS